MSGDFGLTKAQQQSLAGQILAKLDTANGTPSDGKIKKSIWDNFWKNNKLDTTQGHPEKTELNENDDEIDLKTAFKYIMTRIFNAAKKALSAGTTWADDGQLTNDAQSKINEVAKDWLNKASGNNDSQRAAKGAGGADNVPDDNPVQEADTTPNVTKANKALNDEDGAIKAKNALVQLTEQANRAIKAANEAESKEDAEAQIKEADGKIREAEKKLEAAKKKAQEAESALEKAAAEEEGYDTTKQSLTALNQEIRDAETAFNAAKTALETAKTDASKKPTKKVLKETNLKNDGAKHYEKDGDKRLINGTKQDYWKYKDENGETVRAIIDDQGNEDRLIRISGGGLSKKQFITTSLLKQQTGLTYIPEGFECEVKKQDDNITLKFKKGKKDATENIKQYAAFRENISKLNDTWFDQFNNLQPKQQGGVYRLGPIEGKTEKEAQGRFKAYLEGMKTSLDEYKNDPCGLNGEAKIRFEQRMFELSLLIRDAQ